jgi:YHS domain-containing protein
MKNSNSNHTGKDPVCGSIINNLTATTTYRYRGRIFHFCSAYCREKFSKKPRHYLGKRRHRQLPPRMRQRIHGIKGFNPYSAKTSFRVRCVR